MKHKNRKRWLTALVSLVVMLVYLACVGLAENETVVPDADTPAVIEEILETDTPTEEPVQENPAQDEQPVEAPTEPAVEVTDDPAPPTEVPTEVPAEQPPVDPASLFQVEIKQPDGWFNTPERNIRILIIPKTEQLWSKVSYRMDSDEWQEVKDNFSFKDNAYYADVPVTYNGMVTVRVYAANDGCYDTKQAIRMFDHHAPEVTAGIKDTMLHVVATDDLSEVAGIQVNGLLFTTLPDGTLDVRIEEPLNAYKQFAIRAYDYAGNFSEPVTLDNPYYQEATPTPKATKNPRPPRSPRRHPPPSLRPP